MCGIAGVLGQPEHDNAACVVDKMLDAMRHRGPDQDGLWTSPVPGAVFGHRRLSIIDLSETDTTRGMLYAFAGVLGVPLSPRAPEHQLLRAMLSRGKALFILDNIAR